MNCDGSKVSRMNRSQVTAFVHAYPWEDYADYCEFGHRACSDERGGACLDEALYRHEAEAPNCPAPPCPSGEPLRIRRGVDDDDPGDDEPD